MKHFSDDDLLALLNNTESDRVEYKESFKGDVPKKAREAICAFANDFPNHNEAGVLFIGAKDTGEPSGLDISDDLLRNLANMKSDGKILPLPVLTVEKRRLKGQAMAVITVMPSDMPPVRYDGRVWIRTGPRRSLATSQDERILNEKRKYKDIPFDIYPVPSAKITDLSKLIFESEYLPSAFASDILEANERTYEEKLASCKMIASLEDTTPTILGLLTLGVSPREFIAGAFIQFLRIAGTELTDEISDAEEIDGTIATMLRRLEEKTRAHNTIAINVTQSETHKASSAYPSVAIQQLVYNAVLHRSYEKTNAPVRFYWFDDRIEITSPGGPYGCVTKENFGKAGFTDYRNPNLATVLKNLGYIQSFGRGISLAQKAMQDNGSPSIEFTPNDQAILCTLRKKP